MDPEAPTGDSRRGPRRWKRWLFLVLAFLPVIAFGISNLVLGSSWFLGRIAGKIEARTTLKANIGGASWSPWNGATFREIRIEQPTALQSIVAEPLVHIESLRVTPIWSEWLHGRPAVKDINLKSPRIVLPLELISHFAPPQPAPAVAATGPPPTPPNAPPVPPPTPTAAAPLPQSAAAPPKSSAPRNPTDFIHLTDASFAIVFGGNKTPLFESRNVSGSIPAGGDPANSSLLIGALDLVGQNTFTQLRLPLRWQSPLISFGLNEEKIGSVNLKFAGQLALLTNFPLAFEAIAPAQPGALIEFPGGNTFQAAEISGNTRFRGLLAAPATWQADFVTAATKPVIHANGKDTQFDRAQSITVLRGGTLSCVDARIVGDDLSLLGNATILSNGSTAAILRVVAPPETTTSIVQQLFPGLQAPPSFSAMSTPQRVALDLEAFGSLGNLQFRLGKNGPLVGAPQPPATVTPP